MAFKLWFMTTGFAYTGWVAWLLAVVAIGLMIKFKDVRPYLFAFALFMITAGMVIFIYLVVPFNWEVLYHTNTFSNLF